MGDSIGTDNNIPFCVIEEASYNEDRNNKLTGLMLYIVVADDTMEEASVGVNMVCQQFGKLYQECLPSSVTTHMQDTYNPHNVTAQQIGAAEEQHIHTISDLPVTVSTTDLEDGVSALPAGTFYFVYEE